MSIHPSIRIIAIILLALMLQRLPVLPVLALAAVLFVWVTFASVKTYLRMMRRMRWLLATMLLIYAFTTPGEYLADWPFWIAPTHEGLNAGVMQALRLSVMLAGLALLLQLTTREQLVLGFLQLLRPLRHIGIDTERFAARLWLTLHYVEQPRPERTPAAMFERLKSFHLDDVGESPMTIHLDAPAFNGLDWLVLFVLLVWGIAIL